MSAQGQQFSGFTQGSREYARLLMAMFCAGMAVFAQLYSPQAALPAMARGVYQLALMLRRFLSLRRLQVWLSPLLFGHLWLMRGGAPAP